METVKKSGLAILFLLLFWILVFDFQRILFTIHNLDKFAESSFFEWIQMFFYSIRLDMAAASMLSAIPFLFLVAYIIFQKRVLFIVFATVLIIELVLVSMVHAGEINAYGEWNHKLTSRVFMHLKNPDEVVRTADYGMTFWFIVYLTLEIVFGWKVFKYLLNSQRFIVSQSSVLTKVLTFIPGVPIVLGILFVFARGGVQQIPINIDAAYYSKNYTVNDTSVNSIYFFGKSFLLHKRSNIGEFLSDYSKEEIKEALSDFYTYEKEHDVLILENESPNLVFLILESWTSTISNRLSGKPGGTEHFDELSKEGVLFTNLYSTASTSEIGNASIFSGYPALPEISISMQPFKHRKLKSINQSIADRGYTSGYLFSGDLKYGNIDSYLIDHGFDRVEDEKDFPSELKRGKLNYFDEDLYRLFLAKINKQEEPFMECAFTGSTHSPYDYPGHNKEEWTGDEKNFMNSVIYADECLDDFMNKAKKEAWYENTLFVIVADHGHASPYVSNPSDPEFYRIPLLLYGPALKEEAKGMVIDKVGSQADIARTLLNQMKTEGIEEDYPWSKDLLNPEVPEFALMATTRGFAWVTPHGGFTFHLDYQKYLINTYDEDILNKERKRCDAFMQLLYQHYEKL